MTFALYNIEFNNNTAKIQFPPICPHCNLGIVPEILYVSKLTERMLSLDFSTGLPG